MESAGIRWNQIANLAIHLIIGFECSEIQHRTKFAVSTSHYFGGRFRLSISGEKTLLVAHYSSVVGFRHEISEIPIVLLERRVQM